jgi:hypothetical protein
MSTLDQITKEKQRVGEALARVDAQREKLTGQRGELEAAERVLARYGEGTRARRSAAAKAPTTAREATAPVQSRRRSRTATAKPAGGKRSSLTLSDRVLALATGKTQQEIAAACKGVPPVVVAFPDCFTRLGGDQYINSASTGAWEDFLLHEMLLAIEQRFGCGGTGRRGVFGKSSGGYGAITLIGELPRTRPVNSTPPLVRAPGHRRRSRPAPPRSLSKPDRARRCRACQKRSLRGD